MGSIKILPDEVINKIAAGEIVERPASIVKELIENSIDAKSSEISIAFEKGGKRKIVVKDNGIGMDKRDSILAFEHHATSKIEKVEDIENIKTLGFRGEALPSIASVSKLTLRTISNSDIEKANFTGTKIEIIGGRITKVEEISWAKGTEIEVSNLFFNLPVRKKFMKSDLVESSHIIKVVNHYAISNPEVGFRLKSGAKTILDIHGVKNLSERVRQVFKEEDLKNCKEIDFESGEIGISGLTSLPHFYKYNTSFQYFFINGRMVRDRLISSVLFKIYRQFLPSGTYPFSIIFIKIPETEVDVNVHPAKLEVRFKNPGRFSSVLKRAIEETLETNKDIDFFSMPSENNYFIRRKDIDENEFFNTQKYKSFNMLSDSEESEGSARQIIFDTDTENAIQSRSEEISKFEDENSDWNKEKGIKILGQFNNTFIVAVSEEGILIIDQHVAHEKILFEKLIRDIKESRVNRGKLLFPIRIKLSKTVEMDFGETIKELDRCGFKCELFGKEEIVIREIPYFINPEDAKEIAMDIIQNVSSIKSISIEEFDKKMAASMACKSAVKANEKLSYEKMKYIVETLFTLDNPSHCPHGRPIILMLKEKDIMKYFHRI